MKHKIPEFYWPVNSTKIYAKANFMGLFPLVVLLKNTQPANF